MKDQLLKFAGLCLLAAWAVPAGALLNEIEQSYELHIDEVSLPANPAGRVVIRYCSGCKPIIHRVTAETQYLVLDHAQVEAPVSEPADRAICTVPFPVFRTAWQRDQVDDYVTVYYDPETGDVNRIELTWRDAGKACRKLPGLT